MRSIAAVFLLSLAVPARGRADKTDTQPPPVRFSERIAPIAKERCDGCHAKAPGGPMDSYSHARSLVTPGKPDESPYLNLSKTHPPAWGDAAGLVREWIASGAHE